MIPSIDPTTAQPFTFPSDLPKPSRPLGYGVKTSVLITTFDSGHEQRRVKGDIRRTWDCSYIYLTLAQYLSLKNFFMRTMNCHAFYWTEPMTDDRYTVRFDMDALVIANKYHGPQGPGYEASFKLIEVF